jgi:hypothetical protein
LMDIFRVVDRQLHLERKKTSAFRQLPLDT